MTNYDHFNEGLVNAVRAMDSILYMTDMRNRHIEEAYYDKIPVQTIANHLGMSRRGVYDVLRRRGMHYGKPGTPAGTEGKLREGDTAYLPSREGTNT